MAFKKDGGDIQFIVLNTQGDLGATVRGKKIQKKN